MHRGQWWARKTDLQGRQKQIEFVGYASKKTFARDPLDQELKATFTIKRACVGGHQGKFLDCISDRQSARPYIPAAELYKQFEATRTTLYYRLEHLRLLGFLSRTPIGESDGKLVWGWSLSEKFRREVG